MRTFYDKVSVFIIDEVKAMSAAQLALLDETMCKIFDPGGREKDRDGKPFGEKTMLFMGDAAQLRHGPLDKYRPYTSGAMWPMTSRVPV